jgi:hypothetical protein
LLDGRCSQYRRCIGELDRRWNFLVEQVLQGIVRGFPGFACQNLLGGAFDHAGIRPVSLADQRIDGGGSLFGVQARVILQDAELLGSHLHVVADV